MRSLHDRSADTEAPVFMGPYCRDCADEVCTVAEHRGLTDTDVPMTRCPNCLDPTCCGCDDPAMTGGAA